MITCIALISAPQVDQTQVSTANWKRSLCGRPGHPDVGPSSAETRKDESFETGVPASIPWSESACADNVRNNHKTEFAKLSSAAFLQTREARQVGEGRSARGNDASGLEHKVSSRLVSWDARAMLGS
jgi:hypothetical protein